ncbi:MAG: FHA domain-containing protein [Myxococcales bacterium]|nr:MAG: FHA domain-containing protein [Myxococcales bacterium]
MAGRGASATLRKPGFSPTLRPLPHPLPRGARHLPPLRRQRRRGRGRDPQRRQRRAPELDAAAPGRGRAARPQPPAPERRRAADAAGGEQRRRAHRGGRADRPVAPRRARRVRGAAGRDAGQRPLAAVGAQGLRRPRSAAARARGREDLVPAAGRAAAAAGPDRAVPRRHAPGLARRHLALVAPRRAATTARGATLSFRLRYLHHNLELAPGQFVIGRSTDCQLSLDDPLVSRRHAKITIQADGVFVEDLGSRNGVLVDGVRIEGRRRVTDGNRITIGSQDMTLLEGQRERATTMSAVPSSLVTFVGEGTLSGLERGPVLTSGFASSVAVPPAAVPTSPSPEPPLEDQSRRNDTFKLLGGVADKAIAMGRAEDAERLLQAVLNQVMDNARQRRISDPATIEQAARFAARLASSTSKTSWFDYVIELYALEEKVMPAAVVDELHLAIRKVPSPRLGALRDYIEALQDRTQAGNLNPSERFVLQRIEGLMRLASLK